MKARKIKSFEREYVVTRDGRVFRRLKDGKHSELSPAKNDDGYLTVVLYKDNKPHFKYVHDLVAQAFSDNSDNAKLVNHKDGDKGNNSADNLEWAHPDANTQHAYDRGLATGPKGEDNGKAKLTAEQVRKIRKSDQPGTKLADLYGVDPAAISMIRNRKRWK